MYHGFKPQKQKHYILIDNGVSKGSCDIHIKVYTDRKHGPYSQNILFFS